MLSFDLSAQMTAKSPLASATSASPELELNDWSIYADQESHTYFIDFEQLAINVNKVMVKSTNGELMWQEDVFDLPVNSIYELDFSNFSAGEYYIELEAFTGVIRKVVQHKG
jgi:hypothetical protein